MDNLASDATIAALKAGLTERDAEIRRAMEYGTAFAKAFVAEHFPDNAEWRPLSDIVGLLTQVDNMTTIARDYRARLERAEAALRTAREEQSNAIGVGMTIAAGIVMSCWGDQVAAEEILGAAGIDSEADCRAMGVDDYDINLVRPALENMDRKSERKAATPPALGDTA